MKVIFCGGGTVGHLTPAISMAEIILKKDKGSKILFIGRDGGQENEIILKRGFELKTVKMLPFVRRVSMKNFKSASYLAKSVIEAKKIIKDFSPDVVIGTGGYVCWPVIRAAQRLKISTFLHESNYIPGLATKLLAAKCDKVMLHFKQSEEYFKKKKNLVTVGNPLPEAFKNVTRDEARKKLGLSTGDFFILSFGGSIGADKINQSIISLMNGYSTKKSNVKHLHATGKRYFEKIKSENSLLAEGYNGCKIIPFINDMPLYMKAADTVISRCGAMTLSEIAECETVPILIPSPNVTDNHQYKNAKVFTDSGAALMIDESELNDRTLLDAVRYLFTNRGIREKMKKELKKFKSEDSEGAIYNLIKGAACK